MTQVAPPEPGVANPLERPRRSTWLRDTLEVLLIALILYLVIANALQTVRVDGQSMVGSLNDQDLLNEVGVIDQISVLMKNPEIREGTEGPRRVLEKLQVARCRSYPEES